MSVMMTMLPTTMPKLIYVWAKLRVPLNSVEVMMAHQQNATKFALVSADLGFVYKLQRSPSQPFQTLALNALHIYSLLLWRLIPGPNADVIVAL